MTYQGRRAQSRVEREARQQRYILIGAGVVAGLLVIILLTALWDFYVRQPAEPVARVNDQQITTGEFQATVRYQRFQLIDQLRRFREFAQEAPDLAGFFTQQTDQLVQQLDPRSAQSLGQFVLNRMAEDRLIRAEADARGIVVSPADIDRQFRENFGYFPDGRPTSTATATDLPEAFLTYVPPTLDPTVVAGWTPTPTLTATATLTPTATATAGPSATPVPTFTPAPTLTPVSTQEFAAEVAQYTGDYRRLTGLNDAQLRGFIENDLYRQRLQAAIEAEVQPVSEFRQTQHILVADEQTAITVTQRLEAGESWDALAAEFGTDGTATRGGDLGWVGRDGSFDETFVEAALNTPIGTVSAPVQTQFGWHLIRVLASEQRPLRADQLQRARETAWTDWLTGATSATREDGTPVIELFPIWTQRVPTDPATPRELLQPLPPLTPTPGPSPTAP
jgi:hypothetical protein